MKQFQIPSAAELYAYEQRARRERAEAQSALVKAAFSGLRKLVVNVFTKPYAARPKAVSHA